MNAPFVYGLVDPAMPSHVRYVGMASSRRRPSQHANNARRGSMVNPHLSNWIRKIQAAGREPETVVLEQLAPDTTRAFVGFVETCYISALSKIGHRLTNLAPGGNGGNSREAYEKVSRALTGKKLGPRPWTAERRANNPNIGRHCSPEKKAKLSAALKGRQTHAVTDKMRLLARERMRGNKYSQGIKASAETREKLSKFQRKRFENKDNRVWSTPKSRAAIAAANSRRVWTVEARANASAASKAAHAKRKAQQC